MRAVELIEKKRDGLSLTQKEIDFLIDGYVKGSIPDYQMSAFLMAVMFRGLNDLEQAYLTNAMLHSGEVIDLSPVAGVKVDKHSTGGVGDKTTLVVAPIVAACGAKLAKMSGRGLGHTGGTLDKLESIPGYRIEISSADFYKQVNEIGLAVIGQTANITPADKLLYSLRDVTGTVQSVGLIASSIMSKKLASGADKILLDVKVGSGAFMKTKEDAIELAKAMVAIGKNTGKETVAVLTNMDEPLGSAIGNSLEVIEAIDTLKGHGPKDFMELCFALSSELVLLAGLAKDIKEASKMVEAVIADKTALNKLRQMITYQKGNPNVIDDYDIFGTAKHKIKVLSRKDGYLAHVDAMNIGTAAMKLGAGRQTKEEAIDPVVGIMIQKKVGMKVSIGDTIAIIHSNGKNEEEAYEMIIDAFHIEENKITPQEIIIDIVR
ncbi:MAG TPA: pyrimidine-nucleoside phosphorylase [Bacilli bacterium]|nr:pyrimidine-nucleoside phosphorylase [Bacilli bacterium]